MLSEHGKDHILKAIEKCDVDLLNKQCRRLSRRCDLIRFKLATFDDHEIEKDEKEDLTEEHDLLSGLICFLDDIILGITEF